MSKTDIRYCAGCASSPDPGAQYQNQKYGHGKRVHNTCKPRTADSPIPYRCTVCGLKKET